MEPNPPIQTPIQPPYQQPPVAPITPAPHAPHPPHPPSNAVQIVWQWLTYALWSWSLSCLSILLSGILAYFFVNKDFSYEFLIYAFGSLLVLLPMAFVADRIYSKKEPQQKHGFAAVVMVLNALIVFLVSIGAILTAVITALGMLLNPGGTSSKVTIILSSLVIAALGFLLFIRILNPVKLRKVVHLFPLIIVGVTVVAVIAAFVGPLSKQISARGDKLIENNLSTVNRGVQDYASKNSKLPASLNDIKVSSDGAKELISSGKVEYIPGAKTTTSTSKYSTYSTSKLNYKLCVNYKVAKDPDNANTSASSGYISTYAHNSGRVCYDVSTTSY